MPTSEIIRAFLSHASSTSSRSTALQPLSWLTGILISGLVIAPKWKAPNWVLILIAIMLGLTVALFLASYGYYALKKPDALRSERFTLSKMAIEKNLIGDNTTGLTEVADFGETTSLKVLPDKQGAKE